MTDRMDLPGWYERLKRNRFALIAGAVVVVMVSFEAVRVFLTQTLPWLLTFVGPVGEFLSPFVRFVGEWATAVALAVMTIGWATAILFWQANRAKAKALAAVQEVTKEVSDYLERMSDYLERMRAALSTAALPRAGRSAGTGTAPVRVPLLVRLAAMAKAEPVRSVVVAYSEMEEVIRRLLRELNVAGVEQQSDTRLIDIALSKGAISPESAEAVRRTLDIRNLALQVGPAIDTARALQNLELSDTIITNLETWPRDSDGRVIDPDVL